MDLGRLKERASAVNARREAEARSKKSSGKKPVFTPRRVMIWLVELIVLVFALEHFVWKPWRIRNSPEKTVRKEYLKGQVIPLLGDSALVLRGLTEASAARMAAIDGLAPGAVTAQAAQIQVSRDRLLPIEVENSVGMRFRLIPNGSFLMGSPAHEKGRGDGEVQHVRDVPTPFYLGALEVTQAQWKAVMGADSNPSGFLANRRPVEELKWYAAQQFVVALCEKEGVPRWTYRLPSEAEWEYACRAGALAAYHFGNERARLHEFDFFQDNSHGRTQICGLKRPNAFGLHDMHGNVWEWCRDAYRNYPGSTAADNTGGMWRVIRGGNFHVAATECRSAERVRLPPESHGNLLGFRVMRVLPELFEGVDMPALPGLSPNETILKDPGKNPLEGDGD